MHSPADHFERLWTLGMRAFVVALLLILATAAGLLALILA